MFVKIPGESMCCITHANAVKLLSLLCVDPTVEAHLVCRKHLHNSRLIVCLASF